MIVESARRRSTSLLKGLWMDALDLVKQLAEKAKEKNELVRVSKEFANKFKAIAVHYRCDQEEIEEMKRIARNDMDEAEESINAMYLEIIPVLEDKEINERIRARIEKEANDK
jgi:hypothetical protein